MPPGPVEQAAPVEFAGLVTVEVEAEVAVDAAGLVLGLQNEDRHQGQDGKHGNGDVGEHVHGLIHFPEDRVDQDVGLRFPVKHVDGLVGEVLQVVFPLFPADARLGPWPLGLILSAGHAELRPRLLFFQLLEHGYAVAFDPVALKPCPL